MARATKKMLRSLTELLAAATDLPLTLESHNPGDYTRHRIYRGMQNHGVSQDPFGARSYRAGECEEALRMALRGAEAMNPELFRARVSAFYAKKSAT